MNGLSTYAPLAAEAVAAIERREAQYPALIALGKISSEQAEQEIRVWSAIAADWHWVVTMQRPDAPAATLQEKIAAVQDSVSRADTALVRAFHRSDSSVRQAFAVDMSFLEMEHRFGDAAMPFIDAWHRYHRFADLLKWYRRELPDSSRKPIAWFVDLHTQAMKNPPHKAARLAA
ncbi:hypothetical protein [Sphingobium sp.]|uniref:hypothetical protein n=1 Tax=Sphingobium sp. TaxID=1912891 RepID=UPI003BB4DFAB